MFLLLGVENNLHLKTQTADRENFNFDDKAQTIKMNFK